MNRPVRRALAVAVAGLLLLAGCSDNPEPAPLEPSSSPSTSESPDAAPEMPDEARENTPEGAEAFVRYWVEVLNHATVSGETQILRDHSSSDCTSCQSILDLIDSTYGDGGAIQSEGWKINQMSVALGPGNPAPASAALVIISSPQSFTDSESQPVRRTKGGRQPIDLSLSWSSKTGWRVDALRVLQ